MPITNAQELDIIKLCNSFFNGAPGEQFLKDFIAAFEGGADLEDLANAFENSSAYTDIILGGQTNDIGAIVNVLMNTYGLTPGNTDQSTPDWIAENFFTTQLEGGSSIAELILLANNYLDGEVDPAFVAIQTLYNNKALLAQAYSAAKTSTDVAVLQSIYDGLTGDFPLTQADIEAIVASAPGDNAIGEPPTFTLAASASSVTEDQTITYTVTASKPVSQDTVVTFNIEPGDGTAPDQGTGSTNLNDFPIGSFNPVSVTISAGDTSASFDVNAVNDGLNELPENYSVIAEVNGQSMGETTQLLDGAGIFRLTLNRDDFTGTAFNDGFFADPELSGAALTDTLQNFDELDGGNGTDMLTATLVGDTVTPAPTTVTPMLTSIEEVNVRFAEQGATLNFANSTGVTSVIANQSSAAGTFANLGAAGELGVANQSSDVTFSGSTASSLEVGLHSVGATGATTVDLTDAIATSLTLHLDDNDDSLVTLQQNAGTATSINAVLSGDNVIDFLNVDDAATTLSVGGSGSLTADGTNSSFAALENLNVFDNASVDLSAIGTLALLETIAASGTSGNVSVQVDDTATSIATGSGNDNVVQTAALAANAQVNLGGGDDTYTVGAATDDTTASVEAGLGEDTLTATATILNTPIASPGIYMGFDVLAVSDALGNGDSIDVSTFAGVDSFKAEDGVAAAGTATTTNIGNGSRVTLGGNLGANTGTLNVQLVDATGSNDELDFVIDTGIAQNNDATVDMTAVTATAVTSGVETLNVNSTGTLSTPVTAGNATDVADNTLALTDNDLVTLNIFGDQMLTFTSGAAMEDLATIDASGNTAGVTIDVSAAMATAPAINITGTGEADTLTGTGRDDTILGGGGDDIINGGAGDDAINGGAGADVINSGTGLDQVVGGDGLNTFIVNANANGNIFATILDAASGDKLQFTDQGTETFASTKLSLGGTAVFQDYLNLAANGDGSTNGAISWFEFGANTYVVEDLDAGNSFANGVDMVVELSGLVDLSTAGGTGTNILTLA